MRIVSLLPSATEIVCGLGLRDDLVGVTHECDYPIDVSDLPKVTKTLIPHDASSVEIDGLVRQRMETEQALYSLDMPVLESLEPDLIVTQTLCDVCAVAESEVQSAVCALPGNPQVINLEPTRLADVLDCIGQVGQAAGRPAEAEKYIAQLKHRIDAVSQRSQHIKRRPSVMLLEWIDPPFCAGHWSPELVDIAGGTEAIGVAGERSVTTPWEEIVTADPEVMVIACCGFDVPRTMLDLPILRSYPNWRSLSCATNNRVYVVDGAAYFSRPGPRLVDSLEILANALHPEVHPLPDGLTAATHV
jgi:iron complex transport system substrate-binding protein